MDLGLTTSQAAPQRRVEPFERNPKSKIENPKSITVLFAGGGSGGHIVPGLAIAERLLELNHQSKSIFACSQRAIDASMLSKAGAEFVPLPARPPSLSPLRAAAFLRNFIQSKRIVSKLICERMVDQVVALGGFVAAPAVSAAKACGVPVILINLDSPPGKANRWIAKRSDQVLSAIVLPAHPRFAQRIVGMPIRRRAIAPADATQCRLRLRLAPESKTLLVTGASQGATSINSFMLAFAQAHSALFKGWQVLHIAGAGADKPIRQAYVSAGIHATVVEFLDEIGLAWGAADLAISRAGASSVAEAAMNSVPTLFLPYPYHKDMHQRHNAQPLVELGGAAIEIDRIDAKANLQSIGPVLHRLMGDAARRTAMRQNLRAQPWPDAAAAIAQLLVANPTIKSSKA